MIRFLQKLLILWDKKKFLTLLEMESDYLEGIYQKAMNRDLSDLRGRLAKLRAIKNPRNETNREMVELEAEINETEKYRQIMKNTDEKRLDLGNQIEKYKRKLWRF